MFVSVGGRNTRGGSRLVSFVECGNGFRSERQRKRINSREKTTRAETRVETLHTVRAVREHSPASEERGSGGLAGMGFMANIVGLTDLTSDELIGSPESVTFTVLTETELDATWSVAEGLFEMVRFGGTVDVDGFDLRDWLADGRRELNKDCRDSTKRS